MEQIAQYFAQITQGYPPLDPDALSQRDRDILNSSDISEEPKLSVNEVSEQIRKSKKKNQGSQVSSQKSLLKNSMLS